MQHTSTKGNALIFHMLQVKQLLGQYIWEFLKPRGPQLKKYEHGTNICILSNVVSYHMRYLHHNGNVVFTYPIRTACDGITSITIYVNYL